MMQDSIMMMFQMQDGNFTPGGSAPTPLPPIPVTGVTYYTPNGSDGITLGYYTPDLNDLINSYYIYV
jgi:hypothetical protein